MIPNPMTPRPAPVTAVHRHTPSMPLTSSTTNATSHNAVPIATGNHRPVSDLDSAGGCRYVFFTP